MDGIVNILKPPGMTSHDVVAFVRRCTKIKKVGHTGTLDPGAVGVLPICIGKATKVSDLIMAEEKEYRAEVKLGVTTDTQDSYGEILEQKKVIADEQSIRNVIAGFIGTIEQVPPMYSAIKINGQKLYELARQGIEIERKSREVIIHDIKIIKIDLENNRVLIHVKCSKGTYIRTLCYDIGEKLGCGAHMSFLLRTRSGQFDIDGTITVEEMEQHSSEGTMEQLLFPVDSVFESYNRISVDTAVETKIRNGNEIPIDRLKSENKYSLGDTLRVYNSNSDFLCLSRIENNKDGNTVIKLVKSFY